MRVLLSICLLITLLASFSCKKARILTGAGVTLEFSRDTIIFDTVFTSIGSATRNVKIYNPYDQPVIISYIELAGGKGSNFRLNIDGIPSIRETEIELKANDSLYIFCEVTVDPNGSNTPLIITDSIVFELNGTTQDIDLVAWGQDAYFYATTIFETGNSWTLPNDKPNVFYGWALVDSNACLVIQEGTNIHFHKGSGMLIYKDACLKINGTASNPVIIEGDRLEYEYENTPGQWDRIWLYATSRDNEINHAIIRNANIGIHVDTIGTSQEALPTLTIRNTRIENMAGVGLLAQGSEVVAENSLFANCGQYTAALTLGGDYDFKHCTFANYWSSPAREQGQVLLRNYYEDADKNIISRDLTNANFSNCILYGNMVEELQLDEKTGGLFNYNFSHCLIRSDADTLDDLYVVNCIISPNNIMIDEKLHDPVFEDFHNYDYKLFDLSKAINQGDPALLPLMQNSADLLNQSRTDGAPDMGAYEFQ